MMPQSSARLCERCHAPADVMCQDSCGYNEPLCCKCLKYHKLKISVHDLTPVSSEGRNFVEELVEKDRHSWYQKTNH
jgi:hypothetical protein